MAEDNSVGREPLPTPPYLPFRTFKSYIESLSSSGIPAKIDRTVLRSRSGSEQTMILASLRYLGLISADGVPTVALTKYVNAEAGDRQTVLGELLKMRYAFLFLSNFNLKNAVPSQMRTAFEDQGLSGGTVQKAIAFFLGAAQEAGIEVSSFLKVRAARGASQSRRRARPGAGASQNGDDTNAVDQPNRTVAQTLVDLLDPESMNEEEQKAIWTLLKWAKTQEAKAEEAAAD